MVRSKETKSLDETGQNCCTDPLRIVALFASGVDLHLVCYPCRPACRCAPRVPALAIASDSSLLDFRALFLCGQKAAGSYLFRLIVPFPPVVGLSCVVSSEDGPRALLL